MVWDEYRDLRRIPRVRAFMQFVRTAVARQTDLIEGRRPLRPPAPTR